MTPSHLKDDILVSFGEALPPEHEGEEVVVGIDGITQKPKARLVQLWDYSLCAWREAEVVDPGWVLPLVQVGVFMATKPLTHPASSRLLTTVLRQFTRLPERRKCARCEKYF